MSSKEGYRRWKDKLKQDPIRLALHKKMRLDYARKTRDELNRKLKSGPCTDCGNCFDPICMEFDHVRGEKLDHVSNLVNTFRPIEIIMAEVAKCDLVCANCHRLRTKSRWLKSQENI